MPKHKLLNDKDLSFYHIIYLADTNRFYMRSSVFRKLKQSKFSNLRDLPKLEKDEISYIEVPRYFLPLFYDKFLEFNQPYIEATFAESEETNLITVSITHPKDNFCRETGRNICRNRMNKYYGRFIERNNKMNSIMIWWKKNKDPAIKFIRHILP